MRSATQKENLVDKDTKAPESDAVETDDDTEGHFHPRPAVPGEGEGFHPRPATPGDETEGEGFHPRPFHPRP